MDGSSNVTLNVTNNKVKGYEFLGGTAPQVWYKSKVIYTNTTIPTDVWYVKVTINATWVPWLTPMLFDANYSNHAGNLTLNLDAIPSKWVGYLTDYVQSNILAIRRVQNSDSKKTEIFVKMAKPTEYNGSIPLGYITVYSPYVIDSIVACTAAEAGELITLRNGYNSNTSITTSAQIYGNIDTADKWKTGRLITIGKTGKAIDGSTNVTWSYNELGASVSNSWGAGTTAGLLLLL